VFESKLNCRICGSKGKKVTGERCLTRFLIFYNFYRIFWTALTNPQAKQCTGKEKRAIKIRKMKRGEASAVREGRLVQLERGE